MYILVVYWSLQVPTQHHPPNAQLPWKGDACNLPPNHQLEIDLHNKLHKTNKLSNTDSDSTCSSCSSKPNLLTHTESTPCRVHPMPTESLQVRIARLGRSDFARSVGSSGRRGRTPARWVQDGAGWCRRGPSKPSKRASAAPGRGCSQRLDNVRAQVLGPMWKGTAQGSGSLVGRDERCILKEVAATPTNCSGHKLHVVTNNTQLHLDLQSGP